MSMSIFPHGTLNPTCCQDISLKVTNVAGGTKSGDQVSRIHPVGTTIACPEPKDIKVSAELLYL